MQKIKIMKKLFLFAIALLLFGTAMPKAYSQVWCISDIKNHCKDFHHAQQEIKAIYVDVCKKPEKDALHLIKFKPPVVGFSREAMIFNTVDFVFGPYDDRIDAVRDWKFQVNFGDGGNWMDIPKDGITVTITYPLGSSPIFRLAWYSP